MIKKLLSVLFVAACVFGATSCTSDEFTTTQSGDQATVSFSLGLEGGIDTRAISDGSGADVLQYAVFDKDGNRISTIAKVSKTGVSFPTREEITLAKGQTYKIAFWAQDESCQAYTVSDEMNVEINYAGVNNDETRDAFFKSIEFTVTGSTSIDVILKRPFAQINVGAYESDWNAAVASGVEIEKSTATIVKAATSINLLTGEVGAETTDVTVGYTENAIPTEALMVDLDKNGTKEAYKWLSMSYILVADHGTTANTEGMYGAAATTLEDLGFSFIPTSGNAITFAQGLKSVPVQRNWRTNIIGKLLTGDITFNIDIDPIYDGDHNVILPNAVVDGVAYETFADALAAAADGSVITLQGETTFDGVVNGNLFTIDKNVTINLNGHGIVANIPDVTKNSAIFHVVNGGSLTIEGEGNVKVVTNKATNCLAALINNNGGEVTLNGGNWTMSALEYPDALIPTFVDNNSNVNSATLTVNGGTYTFHRNIFRNFANAASHNGYATVATININGGTFVGREHDKGAIWNQRPSATTPAGAGVINVNGGTFINVEIDDEFGAVNYASTAAEVQSILDNATEDVTVFFANDITGDITITQKPGVDVTIMGEQFKYNGVMTTFGNGNQAGTETLTIYGVNFVAANGASSCIVSPDRTVNSKYSYAHNVTVENCTFTDADGVVECAAVRHEDGGDKNWTLKNCVVDNTMHSILQVNNVEGQLVIDGCTVSSKNGANLNSCTNVSMSGCNFDVKGYAVRFGVSSGGNYGTAKNYAIANSTLKSLCDDGDAVIMFRASAVDAKLTLTNTTVDGTTKVSGNTAETTITGLN